MATTSDSRLRGHGLDPMLPCQSLGKFVSLYIAPVHLAILVKNEYVAVDSGGYLCTNSLCALIEAWLHASQRSRNGVPSVLSNPDQGLSTAI